MDELEGVNMGVGNGVGDRGTPTGGYERPGRTRGSAVRQKQKVFMQKENESSTVTAMKILQESISRSNEQLMMVLR